MIVDFILVHFVVYQEGWFRYPAPRAISEDHHRRRRLARRLHRVGRPAASAGG